MEDVWRFEQFWYRLIEKGIWEIRKIGGFLKSWRRGRNLSLNNDGIEFEDVCKIFETYEKKF